MNRYIKHLITAILTVSLLLSLPFVLLAAGSAGTADDPLVTLSYINQTLKPDLIQQVHDQVYAELHKEIWTALSEELKTEVKNEILVSMGIDVSDTSVARSDYEVVMLEKGQTLNAKGACEIVLSSGSAVCVISSQENIAAGVGLRDCTSGTEILNGGSVPLCHYVIIARADGRGALVLSENAYFMVRGSYEII